MKVNLKEPDNGKAWLYAGKSYAPGECDVSEEIGNALKEVGAFAEEPKPTHPPVDSLESVNPGLSAEMKANGYATVEDLNDAKDKDLTDALTSLDKEQLKAIRAELKES